MDPGVESAHPNKTTERPIVRGFTGLTGIRELLIGSIRSIRECYLSCELRSLPHSCHELEYGLKLVLPVMFTHPGRSLHHTPLPLVWATEEIATGKGLCIPAKHL